VTAVFSPIAGLLSAVASIGATETCQQWGRLGSLDKLTRQPASQLTLASGSVA
jgi:hypothetical protein